MSTDERNISVCLCSPVLFRNAPPFAGFMSGSEKLAQEEVYIHHIHALCALIFLQARLGKRLAPPPQDLRSSTGGQKSLGGKKSRGFIPPFRRDEDNEERGPSAGAGWSAGAAQASAGGGGDVEVDERLKSIDPKLVELITNEMLNRSPNVKWVDIAGLDFAKQSVQEIVVWPMLRPDIFTGLRGPPKGLLLFGPPGTIIFVPSFVQQFSVTLSRHR